MRWDRRDALHTFVRMFLIGNAVERALVVVWASFAAAAPAYGAFGLLLFHLRTRVAGAVRRAGVGR